MTHARRTPPPVPLSEAIERARMLGLCGSIGPDGGLHVEGPDRALVDFWASLLHWPCMCAAVRAEQ